MAEEKRPDRPVLESFEGKFTVEDLKFRKLRNGNKVRLILECDFEEGIMGGLEKLLERHVRANFKEFIPPKTQAEKDEAAQQKIKFDSEPGKN